MGAAASFAGCGGEPAGQQGEEGHVDGGGAESGDGGCGGGAAVAPIRSSEVSAVTDRRAAGPA